jgi:hypothetical protein
MLRVTAKSIFSPPEFYSVEDAAALSGLTENTLRCLTDRSDLIRGADYFIRKWQTYSPANNFHYQRHQKFFTQRGLARIIARNYRWIKPLRNRTPEKDFRPGATVPDRGFLAEICELSASLR